MSTAIDLSPSIPAAVDVFNGFIAASTIGDFRCQWVRNAHDNQRLDLVDSSNRTVGSVWKSERHWGTSSGQTCRTRKDGKALVEERLLRQVVDELMGFELYLKAFNAHSKAVYNVIGRVEEDQDHYWMSATTYRALNVYLNRQVRERLEVARFRNPHVRALPRNSMPGNSIAGYGFGALLMSYLEANVIHTYRNGSYLVGAQSMFLTTSTLDDSRNTLAQHPAFPEPMEMTIHRLDPQVLLPRLDAFIHDTIARAQAAA